MQAQRLTPLRVTAIFTRSERLKEKARPTFSSKENNFFVKFQPSRAKCKMYNMCSFWFKQEATHSSLSWAWLEKSYVVQTVPISMQLLVFFCSSSGAKETTRCLTEGGRAGLEHSEGRTATRGARPKLEWTEPKRNT